MKNLLLLALALMLLLPLTACGRTDGEDETQGQITDANVTAPQPGAQAAPPADVTGTAADPAAGMATELISYTCYEEFPQIPDFGSVNGYELLERLDGEGGMVLYYYLSRYGDDDLKAEYWYDAERYSRALIQQGYTSAPPDYGDWLYRSEQCGEYRVALYTLSRKDTEGIFSAKENLLLVVIKPEVPAN